MSRGACPGGAGLRRRLGLAPRTGIAYAIGTPDPAAPRSSSARCGRPLRLGSCRFSGHGAASLTTSYEKRSRLLSGARAQRSNRGMVIRRGPLHG